MIRRRKDNYRAGASQIFNFTPDSYLDRTGRPVYALLYLMGFIVLYEVGTILINPDILDKALTGTKMVVSFVWVQSILKYLGFSHRMTWIVAPAAVVLILTALQITSRSRWYVNVLDFVPMTIECILIVLPLIVLSLLMNRPAADDGREIYRDRTTVVRTLQARQQQTGIDDYDNVPAERSLSSPLMPNIIAGIGAGIFEELIFRLILICLLMLMLQDMLKLSHGWAVFISVLMAAFLFSIHHHVFFLDGRLRTGEQFTAVRFIFRMLAGVYFAGIFAVRGFGITAGAHIFYNVIAAVINASLEA